MEGTKWDAIFVAEHEMLERAMDVLRRELEKLPGEWEVFSLKRAIDFLLEFGHRIHNHKEEKYLFPLLLQRGIPGDGPIRVMLLEHESEEGLLAKMSREVIHLQETTLEAQEAFKQKCLEYLNIRANHIWKENDVLYNMGRKVLTAEDNRFLVEKIHQVNSAYYGADAETKFNQMLNEVERGEKARKSLIYNLSLEQIDAIMECLPIELTFVDADDTVAYFNKLDKEKIFVRTRSVVGRKVQKCHPEKSLPAVQRIIDGFKTGTMNKAEFWIDFMEDKVHIQYFPVRNEAEDYLGVLEVTQKIGHIQNLRGEKRLLD